MRPLLASIALSAAALAAGCGPLGSVDTDGIDLDVRQRLIAQGSTPSPIGGSPQSSRPPAVSVSCPDDVKSEEGTRFRCSATVTRIGSQTTDPIPGGAPGIETPKSETQNFVVEGRVTSDSGDARWVLRPTD